MKNSFFVLVFVLLIASCGNSKSDPWPAAYDNPMVAPFTAAIAENPNSAEAYFRRAEALHQIGSDSLAIIDVRKALQLAPENVEYAQALGLLYLENDQAAEAVNVFKEQLKQSDDAERTRLLLSRAYLANQQFDEASRALQQVLGAHPRNPNALLMLGHVHLGKKDTAAAIRLFEKTIAVDPASYGAHFSLAEIFAAQNRKEAVLLFERTFRLDTFNAGPLFEIAEFYRRQENISDAKAAYRRTILADPDFSPAYLEIGKIYLGEDSVEKALRQFSILSQTQPNNAQAYYYRGRSFERLRQKDSARAAYQQALIYDEQLSDARERLESLTP